MLNPTAIFTAPAAGPASGVATDAASLSSGITTGYFLFSGTDFERGTYTNLREIRTILQACNVILQVNTVYNALSILNGSADPTRAAAQEVKQRLINQLETILGATPYQQHKMAARIAQQLFDPNVGTITSGYVNGASGTSVDAAQVILDTIEANRRYE